MKDKLKVILPILFAIIAAISGMFAVKEQNKDVTLTGTSEYNSNADVQSVTVDTEGDFDFSAIPEYSGEPYVILNDNIPDFIEEDLTTTSFEYYGKLDELNRCTACYACIGKDLMPTEKRGNISSVKPTGWHSVSYSIVDGESLYNRCHLIAYQLTGENANPKNLITGTRYLNVNGMIPFEDKAASYVKERNGHVLYRVTPRFYNNELVARGVQMEGLSVEDEGESVCFNVYCYNVQPGIEIDYLTGDSRLSEETTSTTASDSETHEYVLNTKSKRFHSPECPNVKDINESNKKSYEGTRDYLIQNGYKPCGQCNP